MDTAHADDLCVLRRWSCCSNGVENLERVILVIVVSPTRDVQDSRPCTVAEHLRQVSISIDTLLTDPSM
jgi:hypothetical protein